jgi:hypothetical protein
MAAIPRRSTELALPLIGSTYAARMTEHIYSHLRGRLDSDEEIHEILDKIMKTPPSDLQRGRMGSKTVMRPNPLPVIGLPRMKIGPNDPLFHHIKEDYNELNRITREKYLQNIRRRLGRANSQQKIGFQDQDINRAQGALHDNIKLAKKQLKLRLSNREYAPFNASADELGKS